MNLVPEGLLLERERDARRLFDVLIFPAEEVRLHATVLDAIEHRARCGLTVSPSASRLLIVGLDGTRKVVVDDEANVRLVDPETKGVGGNHRLEPVGHEAV